MTLTEVFPVPSIEIGFENYLKFGVISVILSFLANCSQKTMTELRKLCHGVSSWFGQGPSGGLRGLARGSVARYSCCVPSKLEHALDAASRGLPCFPQVAKRPAIRNWPENASLKESVIRRWWTRWPDHDIGIALPPNIYVLDADTDDAVREMRLLYLPDTLTIRTARGQHRYFRVPHELARMMAPIEGKGSPGPVTWAGSVHPSGHVYEIVMDAPIAHMPGELVLSIGKRQPRTNTGEATQQERELWGQRHARAIEMAHSRATCAPMVNAFLDAQADVRLALRALRYELPDMPTGWAARLFRAGAYLGPHVASGALGHDDAIKELTDLFHELDQQQSNPEHALRSIERGIATGARSAL